MTKRPTVVRLMNIPRSEEAQCGAPVPPQDESSSERLAPTMLHAPCSFNARTLNTGTGCKPLEGEFPQGLGLEQFFQRYVDPLLIRIWPPGLQRTGGRRDW